MQVEGANVKPNYDYQVGNCEPRLAYEQRFVLAIGNRHGSHELMARWPTKDVSGTRRPPLFCRHDTKACDGSLRGRPDSRSPRRYLRHFHPISLHLVSSKRNGMSIAVNVKALVNTIGTTGYHRSPLVGCRNTLLFWQEIRETLRTRTPTENE